MNTLKTLGALLVSTALSGAFCGAAQAADTFIYYNSAYITSSEVGSLSSALTGVGATVTTTTSSSWPTSWTGYKLVIILLPGSAFSSSQASALKTMVNGGGRLVVSGDWGASSSWGNANKYAGDLMTSIGASLSLNTSIIAGSGCTSPASLTSDQVTTGVSNFIIAAGSGVVGGTALVSYGGSSVLSVTQTSGATSSRTPYDVLLSGDVNQFLNSCPGESSSGRNWTLWENLYGGLCIDADSDGFSADTCGGTDCLDTDSTVYPGATEIPYDGIDNDCLDGDITDYDGDGYTSDKMTGGTDCDDTDASVYPGASETEDGGDDDCDGTVDDGTDWYDDDGDGWTEDGGDCDDTDSTEHPGATESCDGADDDCDTTVDEGTDCYDDDGDGYTESSGDCSDGDSDANPGETEIMGNGIDDDCDGVVDDGAFDGDGDGYTSWAGDCDDDDSSAYPGASESADGVDNDCDDEVDEGTVKADDDGDGYAEIDGDCDDTDDSISPDATEDQENGVDDDCDGSIDEGGLGTDDDGDGFSEESGDCDDDNADASPNGTEVEGNGLDDDCDGSIDEVAVDDDDRDGQTVADGDCDDEDGWVYNGAAEMCDGVDNNCDGAIDESCEEPDGEIVPEDKGSCGCAAGPTGAVAPGAGLLGLLALGMALLRRRR